MRLAFRIVADHPILGVGSNNFPVAMLGYLSGEFRSQLAFRFIAHNKCLLIRAETGMVWTCGVLGVPVRRPAQDAGELATSSSRRWLSG